MTRQIQALLLTISLLFFSACSGKQFGIGDLSLPSFSQKTLDKSLPSVQGLQVVTGMSKAALEWQPITDKSIAGYRIFRGDSTSGYKLIATISDRYRSHFTDKNLDPNLHYRYMVSAYTNDGRVSQPTTADAAKTQSRIAAPVIIDASKDLPNRIKLIWRIHPDRITKSYIIERRNEGTDWSSISGVNDRLSVEYIDKEVIPGQTYEYRVIAKTFDGVLSTPSATVRGNAKKLPAAITWVKATDNLPRQIDIIWKDPNPEGYTALYNIYSSPMKSTLFSLVGSSKEPKFTDKFTSDGDTRYYKITAVDQDGLESTQSVEAIHGMTVGASRGPDIEGSIANNAIVLKWKDLDGKARKYTVVKKYWDGWRARKIKITDFKSTSFTDTKIKPDTKYTYYVIGVDKYGIESMPSREVVLSINSQ